MININNNECLRSLSILGWYWFFFELLSVPVTVFILSLYVWQLFKARPEHQKTFSIGYWGALLMVIIVAFFPRGDVLFEKLGLSSLMGAALKPLFEIGVFLVSYTGWQGWTRFTIGAYLSMFAILPLVIGLLTTTGYVVVKKLHKKDD